MGFHPSLGRVRAKYAKYMYTCLCNKKKQHFKKHYQERY